MDSDITLICIPYAGAGISIFKNWEIYMPDWIEVIPIELKGRGKKFNLSLDHTFDDALQTMFHDIREKVCKSNFAIYGHSLGGLIAYELALMLKKELDIEPTNLFLCNTRPPITMDTVKKISHYNDDEFIGELIKFGGLNERIFENEDFFKLILKIVRADFSVFESYKYKKSTLELNSNFTIIQGTNDNFIGTFDIDDWQHSYGKKCSLVRIETGHFLTDIQQSILIDIIVSNLNTQQRLL